MDGVVTNGMHQLQIAVVVILPVSVTVMHVQCFPIMNRLLTDRTFLLLVVCQLLLTRL